jgi:hypothetical protein
MVDQMPPPRPEAGREDWAMLVDPRWTPSFEDESPPAEMMVGGWLLDEEGNPGRFQPNPTYVPAGEDSPTDPADAVMRLILTGEATIDDLVPAIQDAIMELAVTEDGQPLVGAAPDGVSCVAVVTADVHRTRVGADNWADVTVEELLDVLPPDTAILFNPGAPASTRLTPDTLRSGTDVTAGQEA